MVSMPRGEFDSLAETLMEQLPQRDQLMLYTASLTIIEESVQDSKWHVDWHGIPEGLCWTFLVPVWPQDAEAWRGLGGTQLFLESRNAQLFRAAEVAAEASATRAVAEATEAEGAVPKEAWKNFRVVEHRYAPSECLLFEGRVLHRTGPYELGQSHLRVLASLMAAWMRNLSSSETDEQEAGKDLGLAPSPADIRRWDREMPRTGRQ
ncbi:unnamed protein product [Effrenium voratum]|uniref:Phytanoyl-CoA dioxygenase n=1 Tax=Effrenium voratum TaxID=2562239 RepID=A0AA36HTP6_9DINO|nr:unnamed protein product [Effrenium voratum]